MSIVQKRSRSKSTGGRYKSVTKRIANKGSLPAATLVAPLSKRVKRMRGGGAKEMLLACNKANVYDPSSKKTAVADIKSVIDNPANRNFVRRNILTKGAVIETSLGKARVTSRPGQQGFVNAVLVN